jgi:hypothetical protein
MFGDAARLAVGLGMFVLVRAPTAIPAFRCMVPMAHMAAQGIGRLTRPGGGEIGGNVNGTGGCAQEIGRLPSVSYRRRTGALNLRGTLPSSTRGLLTVLKSQHASVSGPRRVLPFVNFRNALRLYG